MLLRKVITIVHIASHIEGARLGEVLEFFLFLCSLGLDAAAGNFLDLVNL